MIWDTTAEETLFITLVMLSQKITAYNYILRNLCMRVLWDYIFEIKEIKCPMPVLNFLVLVTEQRLNFCSMNLGVTLGQVVGIIYTDCAYGAFTERLLIAFRIFAWSIEWFFNIWDFRYPGGFSETRAYKVHDKDPTRVRLVWVLVKDISAFWTCEFVMRRRWRKGGCSGICSK